MYHFSDIQRNLKPLIMPLAMLLGALLCRPITALETATEQMITPVLIFAMLFVTFCRVKARQMRPSMLHFWLLLFQVVVSVVVYLALLPLDAIVAQGAMICVLAPVAMAAVVIGGMLGADVTTMATFSLLSNMFIALVAPVMLTLTGTGVCTFTEILARVAPLLIMPFAVAQCFRLVVPRAAEWVADHSQLSFYMWLVAITVIIGRTTAYIIDLREVSISTQLGLAVVAGVLCVLQFKIGRLLGRRWGDAAAGAQSMGQKNTILAIWMAQSFLNPVSAIAPTAYIVWQNLMNAWQLYRYGKRKTTS